MKFQIGYRTIKTAAGTAISIFLAGQLGLHNFLSAGILTILCIQVTKMRSLRTAWDRFFACVLAMPFSALFFELFAYHPIMIGVLLLFFIPTIVMLNAKDGVVTSIVIILHIYSAGHVTKGLILNELGVILVGIGVALVMNLYMPSAEKKLDEYRCKIEENFIQILREMAGYLRTGKSEWSGKEITVTADMIDGAKSMASRDVEKHLLRTKNIYYQYFAMREKQFEIIERILPLVTTLTLTVTQGEMIADFLEELADNVHPGNTALIFIEKLKVMKVEFEAMELPKTREEFETRAALVQLIKEVDHYLLLKSSFKGMKKGTFVNERKKLEVN
ncbi:MAG: aromatic acid exporter family protein [Bacillota bacterium]|nr:aromatic acid exporter family protein [Bacillota bacterium]